MLIYTERFPTGKRSHIVARMIYQFFLMITYTKVPMEVITCLELKLKGSGRLCLHNPEGTSGVTRWPAEVNGHVGG